MIKRIVLLSGLTLLLLFAAQAQQPVILKVDSLMKKFPSKDTIYVINFWATWCKPCVEEWPLFTELDEKATQRHWNVKVLMVSMDFKEDYQSKLIPFLASHPTGAEVVLLDENNADYFIPKIENAWTGTLPFTLVLNHKGEPGSRTYTEGQVTWDQLLGFVSK